LYIFIYHLLHAHMFPRGRQECEHRDFLTNFDPIG